MMKFFVLLMSFVALKAQAACPELAGNYNCDYDGYSLDVVVSERRQGNNASYSVDYGIGKITIYADGQIHTIPELPGYGSARNFKYRAECGDNNVAFSGTGEMTDGSGKATLKGSLAKTPGGALIRISVRTQETTNINMVCKRN